MSLRVWMLSRSVWTVIGVGLLLLGGQIPLSAQAVPVGKTPVASLSGLQSSDERARDDQPSLHVLKKIIALNMINVNREGAVREIAKKAGTVISYSADVIALDGKVSVQAKSITVEAALQEVLRGLPIAIHVSKSGQIALIAKPQQQAGQSQAVGTIRGRVVDSSTKEGLSGATVSISGTTPSVTTGSEGEFVLSQVPVGEQRVTIKLFGYKLVTRLVTVVEGQPTSLAISLNPVASVLSGVVTTATGKQRRMEIGNDITTLKVDSIQQVAPVSTVADLLEARVPGVQVIRSSGQPGAPRRIRLRGTSSINGNNDPIVIVDGVRVFAAQSDTLFGSRSLARSSGIRSSMDGEGSDIDISYVATPSPLDQIDINSIETLEVFKGPSATSMYGADAANGVIVITTKRGQVGKPIWTFNAKRSLEYIPGKYPAVVRAFGHMAWGEITPSGFCRNSDLHCVIDSVMAFQALNESNLTVLGRGHGTDVSVGVQGGVSNLTYSLTGSAARELGLLQLPALEAERYHTLTGATAPQWMRRPSRYQTWGGTGSVSMAVGPATRTTITSSLFNSHQQQSSLDLAIGQLVNTYIDTMTLATEPLVQGFYERGMAATLTSNTAIQVASNTISWLPLSVTLGLNTISRTDKTLVPRGMAGGTIDSAGFFSIGRGASTTTTLAFAADQISLGRFLTTSVGTDFRARSLATLTSQVNSIPIGMSEPQTLGCPTGASSTGVCGQSTQSTLEESTFGWFIQPKLNLHSRFFVMPGIRLDGGSASGRNAGLTGFPKLNFSWIALDRSDQPLWGAVTMFRPRLAFGMAGVQPGPTDKLRLIADRALSLDGGTSTYGAYVQTLGNTQLRPERSREIEGGFDLELWNNRLSLQVTHYRKDRHDAILNLPVAQSVLGGKSVKTNIGQIRNVGTELTATTAVLESSALSWHLSGSLSKNTNEVIRLAPGLESITERNFSGRAVNVLTRIIPRYPLLGRWAHPILGYQDRNGNQRIDETEILVGDSLVYLGAQEPNFSATLNSNFSWHRVSLHATMQYTDGLSQFNSMGQGFSPGLYDPAAPLGTQAASIALTCGSTSGMHTCKPTSYGMIQTVNMLRLNSLTIRYAAPPAVARRLGSQALSLALHGANLGLWTNYQGKDPNVNAFATGNVTVDTGQLPQPRTWALHVTLTY